VKREQFVAARAQRWRELERLVDALSRSRGRRAPNGVEELPRLYRQTCQDLALARHRIYGRDLIHHLNLLALRGREQLYRRSSSAGRRALEFFARDFPRLVRAEARLFALAGALFYVPFFAMIACAWLAPDVLYDVLDTGTMQYAEEAYDPASDHPGQGRESAGDFLAFGYYIWNNVSISFRTFAGGLLWGVGTIFFLVYNGVFIGAIFGHLTRIGYGETLYPFVVGHGAFELTGIVLSGVAGLKLGRALVAPGRLSRTTALRREGAECGRLLLGFAAMIAVAAFIEGFWSPSSAPPEAKYAVGATLWLAVGAYFALAGRR
jgi:uncharacterized membrane protein SpoIIM required for sporulation